MSLWEIFFDWVPWLPLQLTPPDMQPSLVDGELCRVFLDLSDFCWRVEEVGEEWRCFDLIAERSNLPTPAPDGDWLRSWGQGGDQSQSVAQSLHASAMKWCHPRSLADAVIREKVHDHTLVGRILVESIVRRAHGPTVRQCRLYGRDLTVTSVQVIIYALT
ncbi:MAG TPA: hypothetical protein DDZ51_09590 [Planctomycetaceae bacterium]|nr:hypothetical protein [Planctomycetaceae bacterium]